MRQREELQSEAFNNSGSYTTEIFTLFREREGFYTEMHAHVQYQITVIVAGFGKLVLADQEQKFGPGDVFFIGTNVPHKFERSLVLKQKGQYIKACSLFIHPDVFGKNGLNFIFFSELKNLLMDAQYGLRFTINHFNYYYDLLLKVHTSSGSDIFMQAVKFLERAASDSKGKRKIFVNRSTIEDVILASTPSKFGKVCQFLENNYMRKIELNEAAKMACMSVSTFSRHFKRCMGQSYVEFLRNLRVSHACKLITESKLNIFEIAALTGFKSTAHFNRTFKQIMKTTPQNYYKKSGAINQNFTAVV